MHFCMKGLASYAKRSHGLRDKMAFNLEIPTMADLIGLIAAFLTTLSFLPQTLMVLRSGETAGISLTMYAMFTLGVAAWLTYGVLQASMPIMLANGVTLLLAAIILSLKIRATLKSGARALPAPVQAS